MYSVLNTLSEYADFYISKNITSYTFSLVFEGALSGLRQFLATGRPLKLMKNAFYFTLKAIFILKIFKFLSSIFGHVEKRLD